MNRELVWRLLWGALGPALLELLAGLGFLLLVGLVMIFRHGGYHEVKEAIYRWHERHWDTVRLVAAVAAGVILAAMLVFVAVKVFMPPG